MCKCLFLNKLHYKTEVFMIIYMYEASPYTPGEKNSKHFFYFKEHRIDNILLNRESYHFTFAIVQ